MNLPNLVPKAHRFSIKKRRYFFETKHQNQLCATRTIQKTTLIYHTIPFHFNYIYNTHTHNIHVQTKHAHNQIFCSYIMFSYKWRPLLKFFLLTIPCLVECIPLLDSLRTMKQQQYIIIGLSHTFMTSI